MYSMISLIFANWYLSYVIIVGIVHVNGKALFEKSDQIDLSQNYDDYQIQGLSARSLTDCAAICHNFVDCRAVLMNHGTGISPLFSLLN